jgi:elongator complex protein 1
MNHFMIHTLSESEFSTFTLSQAIFESKGVVCVVDGPQLLITPFAKVNVPPPMAFYTHPCKPIKHVCVDEGIAILCDQSTVEILDVSFKKTRELSVSPSARQVAFHNDVFLTLNSGPESITIYNLTLESQCLINLNFVAVGLIYDAGFLVQSDNGTIYEIDTEHATITQVFKFSTKCERFGKFNDVFVGLNRNKLYFDEQILPDVTSFYALDMYLLCTTLHHKLEFVTTTGEVDATQTRDIEMGSVIVTSAGTSVTLQAPRGNLETISPRPLVCKSIINSLANNKYKDAFMMCRRHRVDSNIIVNTDRANFMSDVDEFVKQIAKEDYLNLFISSLSGDGTNEVCDAIYNALVKVGGYTQSALTALAKKTPQNLEDALRLIKGMDDVEGGLGYLIFLTDSQKLYNTALGYKYSNQVCMISAFVLRSHSSRRWILKSTSPTWKHSPNCLKR